MLTIDFAKFPLSAGQTCVDVGCGQGRHSLTAYLSDGVAVLGIDLGADDLSTAQSRIEDMAPFEPKGSVTFLQGDALSLPLADASIDRVICSEVLEHVPNYIAVIEELNRVLKPGGKLAVSVPRAWPEQICWWLSSEYPKTPGGHIRIFNRKDLRREIERYGFRCYAEHGAHAIHSPYWWLRCLLWNHGDEHPLVKAYHQLLVWDLMKKPWLTQTLDKVLNPVLGKSIVMYFDKPSRALPA